MIYPMLPLPIVAGLNAVFRFPKDFFWNLVRRGSWITELSTSLFFFGFAWALYRCETDGEITTFLLPIDFFVVVLAAGSVVQFVSLLLSVRLKLYVVRKFCVVVFAVFSWLLRDIQYYGSYHAPLVHTAFLPVTVAMLLAFCAIERERINDERGCTNGSRTI